MGIEPLVEGFECGLVAEVEKEAFNGRQATEVIPNSTERFVERIVANEELRRGQQGYHIHVPNHLPGTAARALWAGFKADVQCGRYAVMDMGERNIVSR